MTAPTLDELKKLLGEATPGPWCTVGDKSPNMTGVHAGPSDRGDSYLLFTLINDPDDDGPMGEGGLLPETVAQWKADAALIVALRNTADALIARVESLEGALEALIAIEHAEVPEGEDEFADPYGFVEIASGAFNDALNQFQGLARAALKGEA